MARLEILYSPDPRLRTRAQPVDAVDGVIALLVDHLSGLKRWRLAKPARGPAAVADAPAGAASA